MEKFTTVQDDRLLDYLDGKLEGVHLELLRKELAGSPVLQARLEDLRIVHRSLAQTKLESPSPAFVDKVMKNIHSGSFSPSTLSPRNGLLLLSGSMVAAGILVVMISAGVFDQFQGLISLDQAFPSIPVKEYFKMSLPSVPFNGKLIIKIIVGLNLALAFLVLDKTVLRPFFQRRAGVEL